MPRTASSGVRVLPDSRSQAEEAGLLGAGRAARPIRLGCVGVGSLGGNGVPGGGFLVHRGRCPWRWVRCREQGCILLAGVALNLQDARLEDSLGATESGEGEITAGGNAAVSHGAWGGGCGNPRQPPLAGSSSSQFNSTSS